MVAAMVGSGSILEEVNGSNMRQREKRKAAAALQGPQSQQKPLIVNTRKNLHLVRKLFHALAGIAIAGFTSTHWTASGVCLFLACSSLRWESASVYDSSFRTGISPSSR